MSRNGAKNVSLAFTEAGLTHYGGVYLLHRFLHHLRLRTFLSRRLFVDERNNIYSISERIMALMYPMILGLKNIELSKMLGNNGVFKFIIGLDRFPDPATLRRFLVDKSEILLPRLQSSHNTLRHHFLSSPYEPSSFWIDFDSTAKTLYGKQEGVVKGYNPGKRGRKSYHPLVCTEGKLKDCLGGILRNGNAYTATGVLEMFEDVWKLLPHHERLRVRADAGFYDKKLVELLSENNTEFVIVSDIKGFIKETVLSKRYKKYSDRISYGQFYYQPHGWDREYRFVVSRERMDKEEKTQATLFNIDTYKYRVLVTNMNLTPKRIFDFYDKRTGIERIIRVLKDDFPFATAPTKSFEANAMYMELSMLAYNLMTWFKRSCLPKQWHSYTTYRLRHELLSIPGILIKKENKRILKLPKSTPHEAVIREAEERIKELSPLV